MAMHVTCHNHAWRALAVNIVFRFWSTLLFGVINNLKERIWWNALISHISLDAVNSGFRNQEAIVA